MMLLEKAILETIVYFDIFDYPLRANEIQRWLWKDGANLEDIILALRGSEFLKEKISSKDGFFCLKNREEIIETRLKRYRFAEKKFKKARKVVWFLSRLPGILGIAVCNDLGYSNSSEDGDIDLFVITKKNRVWTGRFLVTLFLKFFRLRPGEAKEDAICPSFFIDEEHLNLRDLAAVSPPEDDIHFVYWINQMTPVFSKNVEGIFANPAEALAKADGIDDIWKKFYDANQWTSAVLPNRRLFLTNPVRNIISNGANPVHKVKIAFRFPSVFGDWFENLLRFRFLSEEIRAVMNKDNNVVIRDGILKLHTNDRRREYLKMFQERVSRHNF